MQKTRYITVDLEVRSSAPFNAFCEFFEQYDLCAMLLEDEESDGWMSNISLDAMNNAETCIQHYLSVLKAMPVQAREDWNKAHHRCMNIGYHSSSSDWGFSDQLTADTLAKMAEMDIAVAFTLYPIDMQDDYIDCYEDEAPN
ncbi:hypothetical protein CS022_00655 [Veronia nyctiphanis]|uniref:Uncharacterized protein n=1 Tax=Veronia nyctiphanis TaxID=1278244 RepID=A0A4Q0Z041_9GAMM|nr:hypothetical protein [Veronia nyctiphanis]RXJ74771.1 hypothetical protein CS022_00655 [Veronia nyctiphanis]